MPAPDVPQWPGSPRPEGAGAEPAAPAAPAAGPAPAPDERGWSEPPRSREDDTLPNMSPGLQYFSDPAAAADPAAPPAATPPAAPAAPSGPTYAPPAGGTPSAAPATPAHGTPEDPADRARRLLIPVADPEAQPAPTPSVAPVLPGRPVAQRPQSVRAPGEELGADGGLPCPWCATRNRPDRHYCTRCAMPMAGDRQAPARLPWWRRLTRGGNREAPWAGDRPRLRRAFDRVLTWLGAAIALTLVILLAVQIPDGVQATRDHFAKRAPVAPDGFRASRSYPGHKPDLAFDKLNNTWWGPGVSESGQGQWIEARFDEPTRLLNLIITPGQSIRADQLSKSALPHRLEALITLADGKTTTRELVLDQGPGPQTRSFRVGKVTSVRFTIKSAYQTSASKQVSIAEIEFFGASNASSS
ncbi:zinc ribbon domain-containing protein [Streptomyces sp. NPDC056160]|uniref:NADase-type glycan-binding domain-containing protein n=1 Tax=Streptomyces sp. NPDC056160 TaxID=3345731 RepID=UPI0035E04B59